MKKRPKRNRASERWLQPYLRMTKVQLLAILDPEMGIEETVRRHKMTKLALAYCIRAEIRRQQREYNKPCPKGHQPGDPACDLMCFMTMLEPIDSPIMHATNDDGTPVELKTISIEDPAHEWLRDALEPVPAVETYPAPEPIKKVAVTTFYGPNGERITHVKRCPLPPRGWACSRGAGHEGPCAARVLTGKEQYDLDFPPESRQCAREFIGRLTPEQNQENLRALLKIIQDRGLEDNVNWQAFKKMYMDLDAQFAVPRRKWWDRIPYSWGWWWRVPYGWLLWLGSVLRTGETPSERIVRRIGTFSDLPTTSDTRLVSSIDIHGPESRPMCDRCLDPTLCKQQGGCVWPPLKGTK